MQHFFSGIIVKRKLLSTPDESVNKEENDVPNLVNGIINAVLFCQILNLKTSNQWRDIS